jgi:hypothetical protein
MATTHIDTLELPHKHPVRPLHTFLPSGVAAYTPVAGHVNHCKQATTPDIEETFQVDIDGDGIIGDAKA